MAADEDQWKLLMRANGDIASTIPFFLLFRCISILDERFASARD
jgi:hypothetical protein